MSEIAVIGIAGKFPDAPDYEKFWDNLVTGHSAIKKYRPRFVDEFSFSAKPSQLNRQAQAYADLSDGNYFDYRFFNIPRDEALKITPEERLLLEEVWHSIEDSGIHLAELRQKVTSVYVGASVTPYADKLHSTKPLVSNADRKKYRGNFANRISYTFGFRGNSLSIDTACSSSLVAIDDAIRSLDCGECDYAIVAGVSFAQAMRAAASSHQPFSQSGQYRVFDQEADGCILGDGVGVVLLERKENAMQLNHHIYGIISGTAVNHCCIDQQSQLCQPDALIDVIQRAYRHAGLSPENVSYVEAHGFGTKLGDSIEVEALNRVFAHHTKKLHFCHIGSLKANIGHLGAAAGIASLIKVLLMLQYKKIPASLHIQEINRSIDFAKSSFVVNTELQTWHEKKHELLVAGINSFSISGINVHLIVSEFNQEKLVASQHETNEEMNVLEVIEEHAEGYPFVLSTKSPQSMMMLIKKWREFTHQPSFNEAHLKDICGTLMCGRRTFPFKFGFYVHDKEDLRQQLESIRPEQLTDAEIRKSNVKNPWCVIVGNFSCESFAKVQSLLKDEAWPKEDQKLYEFLEGYAYLKSLINSGFSPHYLTGEGMGWWVVLCVSEILSIDDALSILNDPDQAKHIHLNRPKISIIDPITSHIIYPYQITPGYLQTLVGGLAIPENDLHYYVNKARLLIESQFVFKKIIDEWAVAYRQKMHVPEVQYRTTDSIVDAENSIYHWLYSDDILRTIEQDRETRRRQLLLWVIIKSAICQIHKEWDLKRNVVTDERIDELLALINDGVISKSLCIELLINDFHNYDRLAAELNLQQNKLTFNSQHYKLLRDANCALTEIKHISDWLQSAANVKFLSEQHSDLAFLEFGKVSKQEYLPNSKILQIRDHEPHTLNETLSYLWVNGVDIHFEKLPINFNHHKVALPLYPFEKNKINDLSLREIPLMDEKIHINRSRLRGLINQIKDSDLKQTYIHLLSSNANNKHDVAITKKTLDELIRQIYQPIPTTTAAQKASKKNLPEVLPINPHGNMKPSFWIHGEQGWPQIFYTISKYLGTDYPVYAFQARGTDSKRLPFSSVKMMAKHYVKAMLSVQKTPPYYIAGYSLGGLVGYEMAQQLVKQDIGPLTLVMFDTYPPINTISQLLNNVDDSYYELAIAALFLHLQKKSFGSVISLEKLKQMPNYFHLIYLAEQIKKKRILSLSVDMIYHTLKAGLDLTHISNSFYSEYALMPLEGVDVIYVRATQDYVGNQNVLGLPQLSLLKQFDYLKPWKDMVNGKFSIINVEADHLSLFSEEKIPLFIDYFKTLLHQ